MNSTCTEIFSEKDITVEDTQGNILYPDGVILKANQLITGIYTSKMTVLARKVFNFGLSKARYCKEEKRVISEFTVKELEEFLGVTHNSLYSQMYGVAKCLRKKEMIIEEKDSNDFVQITLLPKVSYSKGKMILKYEPDCTYLVLDLKSYTKLSKTYYRYLNSGHAIDLYELLRAKLFGVESITIVYENYDLKILLGMIPTNEDIIRAMCKDGLSAKKAVEKYIPQEKRAYEDGNIFSRAIKKAVDEINKCTDIYVEYQLVKGGKGGRIIGVKFTVTEKNKMKKIVINPEDIQSEDDKKTKNISEAEMLEKLVTLKISIQENLDIDNFKELLECANYDTNVILDKYRIAKADGNVKDLVRWLKSAIKEDYKAPIPVIKDDKKESKAKVETSKTTNKFNDFQQRDYTQEEMDEIEKRCLNR